MMRKALEQIGKDHHLNSACNGGHIEVLDAAYLYSLQRRQNHMLVA